jgi:hypothetical protein
MIHANYASHKFFSNHTKETVYWKTNCAAVLECLIWCHLLYYRSHRQRIFISFIILSKTQHQNKVALHLVVFRYFHSLTVKRKFEGSIQCPPPFPPHIFNVHTNFTFSCTPSPCKYSLPVRFLCKLCVYISSLTCLLHALPISSIFHLSVSQYSVTNTNSEALSYAVLSSHIPLPLSGTQILSSALFFFWRVIYRPIRFLLRN